MVNKTKSDDEKLDQKIVVRCSGAEFLRWKKMAEDHGLSMSQMMRAAMDGNKVQSKSDSKAIAELRRQAALLKHILKENPNMDALMQSDMRDTLRLMIVTMKKVMAV